MFLVTKNEYLTFKKDEAKEIVLNHPKEPFYLYLTKNWQQVGWVTLNTCKNEGDDNLTILVDYGVVYTSINKLKEYFKIIEHLRELKIPKQVLETGDFEMHHYRKLRYKFGTYEKTNKIIKKVKELANNPSWDLAVYLND